MNSVADVIRAAAERYGLPPDTMLRMAQIESRMNPGARNPKSSAGGLFQFVDGTWAQYGRGDRMDAAANTDAAMRLTRDNIAHFRARLGRDPTPGETYLLHQQGAGGATKLLQNPNAPAESLVGADAVRLNGGRPGMTAGQFASLWTSKFGDGQSTPTVPPSQMTPGEPAPVSAPTPAAPQQPADDGFAGLLANAAAAYLRPPKTEIRRGARSRFNLPSVS